MEFCIDGVCSELERGNIPELVAESYVPLHPSPPTTNPPVPAEHPRPRGLAYPMVGTFENIPPVSSSHLVCLSLFELFNIPSANIAQISQCSVIKIWDLLVASV